MLLLDYLKLGFGIKYVRLSSNKYTTRVTKLKQSQVLRSSNSSYKKTIISDWYNSGFSGKCSERAFSIEGVILRLRPGPCRGALGVPKNRIFERMDRTERVVHPAASAISLLVDLPWMILLIISCCNFVRFGAMVEGCHEYKCFY